MVGPVIAGEAPRSLVLLAAAEGRHVWYEVHLWAGWAVCVRRQLGWFFLGGGGYKGGSVQ